MSQEDVEGFQRVIDAFHRQDIDALLEELDPEVEWHPVLQVMLGGEATVYRGHARVREMLGDVFATVEIHAEYSQIRDLGGRVIGIGVVRARGRGSGAEIESPYATLVEIKNGKAISIHTYLDPQEALEAAGLQE